MRPGNGQSRRLRPESASRARTACSAGSSLPTQTPRQRPSWKPTQEPSPLLEPEPLRAEPVLAHQALERALGVDAAAEHAVGSRRDRRRVSSSSIDASGRRGILARGGSPRARTESRSRRLRSGFLRLDEPRLGHQRAELARRLDPLDAPDELRRAAVRASRAGRRNARARGSRGSSPCRRRAARRSRRRKGRRPGPPASRPRASGRAAAAGARHRCSSFDDRGRVPPQGSARARCAGNPRGRCASPSARWRASQAMPWRCITASRLWPRSSGVSARDRRTVQSTGARKRRLEAPELAPQESVVEARVVRDEEPAVEPRLRCSRPRPRKGGASATIASVMPVNCWIAYGMRTPGLTSVEYSSTTSPSSHAGRCRPP